MFEEGSGFREVMAILVVSGVAFILIIVFYAWR